MRPTGTYRETPTEGGYLHTEIFAIGLALELHLINLESLLAAYHLGS